MGTKACKDVRTVAAIAQELSRSSIRYIEDLWSPEKIEFVITPRPPAISSAVLEEIIMRSIQGYLKRPGHVVLPDGMIPEEELEKERKNPLLRVRKFWEYWHGSMALDNQKKRTVSAIQTASISLIVS